MHANPKKFGKNQSEQTVITIFWTHMSGQKNKTAHRNIYFYLMELFLILGVMYVLFRIICFQIYGLEGMVHDNAPEYLQLYSPSLLFMWIGKAWCIRGHCAELNTTQIKNNFIIQKNQLSKSWESLQSLENRSHDDTSEWGDHIEPL